MFIIRTFDEAGHKKKSSQALKRRVIMIIHLVENDSLMRTKVTQTQQAKKEEMSVDVYKKAEEGLD